MTEKDIKLRFPHFIIVKASAGSGKTDALTKRYVQFLLSDRIPQNGLKNLLAITFSNNAANEMRERILRILKDLYFEDKKRLEEFENMLSLPKEEIAHKAGLKIEEILENYTDLQIRTIDSFMAKVFKAEALNFNYPPEIEFFFSHKQVLEYALDVYLDHMITSDEGKVFINKLLELLEDKKNKYLWNPKAELLRELGNLFEHFSKTSSSVALSEEGKRLQLYEQKLIHLLDTIIKTIEDNGLEYNASSKIKTKFQEISSIGNFSQFMDLYGKKLPVNKPKKKDQLTQKAYETVKNLWTEFQRLLSQYAFLFSQSFYEPYMMVFMKLTQVLEDIKKREGRVSIEDVNKKISQILIEDIVPDIYFKMGETIHHFLIDEFQDTSPIQWFNLKPLIENSLSMGGSLFIVGDTKQAIYGFRGADYTIMKSLENENPFHSVKNDKRLERLDVNWRSKPKIVQFVENLFEKNETLLSSYQDSLFLTGLNEVRQRAKRQGQGYVKIDKVPYDQKECLRDYLTYHIDELCKRGYSYRDIAILGRRNEEITEIASILNEVRVPFISYSSLDVRFRKIVHELMSLLRFLDSPSDNFSFSLFILSDLYNSFVKHEGVAFDPVDLLLQKRNNFLDEPLYKTFQRSYPNLWDNHFQKIFKLVGYLPIYDLLCLIYNDFRLFYLFPNEEAVLLKFLEIANVFETKGYGNIGDFIEFFSDSEGEKGLFDISLPRSVDAITLMTIHKSKGLGFPIVFVYLEEFDYSRSIPKAVTFDDGKTFTLVKVTKWLADCHEELKKIRSFEEKSIIAEFLNLLYVAFTRAEDELYIICSVKEDNKFPFDFLQNEFGNTYGLKEKKEKLPSYLQETLSVSQSKCAYEFDVRNPDSLRTEERKRGDLIHAAFASIDYATKIHKEKIKDTLAEKARVMGYGGDFNEIIEEVMASVNSKELCSLFEERVGRIAFNEFEISDPYGNLHRIDRLVIDPNEVTILEYKTGEQSEEHKKQVLKYKDLLSSIFPEKTVKTIIFYVEKKTIVSL
ncbi:MAG: UvrD-helicase domain-containing protein [Deltaproteobacteria bacterium]|nr:UvrD-helicase domain-containing protein [Deltaproteobacteria bacterium]